MKEEQKTYLAKQLDQSTESFVNFWKEMQRSEFLMSYLEVGNKSIEKNKDEAKKTPSRYL